MITLNHLIVPARDKVASARWLADLFRLGLRDTSPFSPPGRFAVVRVGDVNSISTMSRPSSHTTMLSSSMTRRSIACWRDCRHSALPTPPTPSADSLGKLTITQVVGASTFTTRMVTISSY
jgi:hypothetical protein